MSHRSTRIYLPGWKLLAGLGCVVALLGTVGVWAATKAEKKQAAETLVKEALHREIYGLNAERDRLLDEAAENVPDFEPAMWHRGYVKYKNEWVKAVDLPQIAADDPRMKVYLKVREDHPDTAEGHLALAEFCNKRGLPDQERAHLHAVLRHNPDHPVARERLGFRRVDGEWMDPAEIALAIEQLNSDREALAKWRSNMEGILKGLKHTSPLRQKIARENLFRINDAGAIPAMEMILSADSEQVSLIVAEALDKMPQHEAAQSLARHAVYSPSQKVRQAAAEALKERPEDTYVPAMLASLSTQIQSRTEVRRGRSGRLMYRHSFFSEGQDENQLLVLDTEYRRVSRDGGSARDSLERAAENMRRRIISNELNRVQQNAQNAQLNARIMEALSTATGEQMPSAEAWWDWWTEHNEVFVEGQKSTRTVRRSQQVDIVDRVLNPQSGGGQAGSTGGQLTMDCLAAGTLVWTAGGAIAIEKIQVGDLVLAQDSETGELAFKPVLRTTIRPKNTLVTIQAGDDTIETSGGHPFWVAGEGWLKARDLKPGMELHGVDSTVQVRSVKRSRDEQTYNLIVEGFNTYFVGNAKILSHDNTVAQPTNAVVPGLLDQ